MVVALDWVEAHCVIPDGANRGRPFRLYDWQFLYLSEFYKVKGDAVYTPGIGAPAFRYRRGLLVGPQKLGKDPLIATQVSLEGVGPALFGGWAGKDDGYACSEHGCRCGWEYAYDPGEPMGTKWSTPLIQITAFSEEATDNTYDVLRPMIELGPLNDLIPRTGEEFIRLPGGGRIDTVTSSAQSRLGQRVTFIVQGEVGIWTRENRMERLADTQYRGVAGMGGRASLITNAWDPSEHSVAQQQFESSSVDIYRQFPQPPANLSYTDRRERHKIHQLVYPPDVRRENGGHLDLASIENEAADLVQRDPAQAARFYGNKLVSGGGRAFDSVAWSGLEQDYRPEPGALIVMGFDGSRSGDWSALVACEVETGFIWPIGIWNPVGGEIPREDVDLRVDEAFATWSVWRMYCDPPYWQDEIAAWAGRYGEEIVNPWETYRPRAIGSAVRNFAVAISTGALHHDGDATLAAHIGHCYRRGLLVRDDKGEPLWTIQKETPDSGLKIDAAMAAVLAWEARTDAVTAGATSQQVESSYTNEDLLVF